MPLHLTTVFILACFRLSFLFQSGEADMALALAARDPASQQVNHVEDEAERIFDARRDYFLFVFCAGFLASCAESTLLCVIAQLINDYLVELGELRCDSVNHKRFLDARATLPKYMPALPASEHLEGQVAHCLIKIHRRHLMHER